MTRRLQIYSPNRIRAVVAVQREHNPEAHDQLLADLCAIVLTGGQGDEVAEADASRQVLEWLAREHVEEGR